MSTHPTPTWLSVDELTARVVDGLAAPDTDADELKSSVHALVSAWKLQGWTIERMIIQLKRVIAVARERPSPDVSWVDIGDLGARVITWCIERYYAEETRGSGG